MDLTEKQGFMGQKKWIQETKINLNEEQGIRGKI